MFNIFKTKGETYSTFEEVLGSAGIYEDVYASKVNTYNMNTKETSKLISFWLRHNPADGELELDAFGRVDLDVLLNALKVRGVDLQKRALIELNSSFDKRRWAIDEGNNTIRATHGHSIAMQQVLEPAMPPEMLYHCTAVGNIESIFEDDLRRMGREYVHLSAKPADALIVCAKHRKPVLIEICTAALVAISYVFYSFENDIWLRGWYFSWVTDFDGKR